MKTDNYGIRGTDRFADSLWFRESEAPFVKNGTATATIRSGDRTPGTHDPKGGVKKGSVIALKIIGKNGEFDPWETTVEVRSVEKKRIMDLTPLDFEGCLPGQRTREELLSAFKEFYHEPFGPERIVTVITFRYV